MEEGDYVFVTAARYDEDQEALAQYQQSIAEELAKTLKVGDEGELDSITVSHIKSPKVDNQQLVVDVTPQGLSINGDPIAKISDVYQKLNMMHQQKMTKQTLIHIIMCIMMKKLMFFDLNFLTHIILRLEQNHIQQEKTILKHKLMKL